MSATDPTNPEQALALLASLGASERLVRHHALVLEAAVALLDGLTKILGPARVPRREVLVGVALHDAGKIEHPSEMSGGGARHEPAGEALLVKAGLSPGVARFCRTHASWSAPDAVLADRLVALADKLWKGKRDEALEAALHAEIAALLGVGAWDVFTKLDDLFERVASGGPGRLARS